MEAHHTLTSVTFTPEDLAYNRRGEFSPRQQSEDRANARGCMLRLAACVGVWALIGILGLLLHVRWLEGLALGLLPFGGFALLGFVFLLATYTWPMKVDVRTARGTLDLVVDRATPQMHKHYLVIGDVSFRVDQEFAGTFEVGATYAVHYLHASKTILSYEKLADAPQSPAPGELQPSPADIASAPDRLAALENMRARRLVTDEEYARKRAEILASL